MALAQVVGPAAADVMRSTQSVAGYVTGLFGMAIVSKLFEMLHGIDSAKVRKDLWSAVIKRLRG
jgi:hypothetical protein